MYIPTIFKNENQEEIQNFISENGFAILINHVNGKICATHIPLIFEQIEGKQFLTGHISRENPQGENFQSNQEVLAIFSGAHSYISSTWYENENVPTWNYIAVHIYGKVSILDEENTLKSLEKLVDKYEKNSENPLKIDDLSEKTMRQVAGIIAFEIEITAIEAVKKLSQNRNETDFNAIISELQKSRNTNANAVAIEMKKCPR